MYGYIYKTTNLINNKIYIGQRKSKVFQSTNYLGSGRYLRNAVNKYGVENFIVELIDISDNREELNNKEIYWIKYYKAYDRNIGYNISKGGIGGGEIWVNNGIENHHIAKDKLPEYIEQGYILGMKPGRLGKSSETRNKNISKALKGRHKSEAQIEKQKASLRNRKQHWYTDGINNKLLTESDVIPEGYYKGRTISEEIKIKCGLKNKGRIPWNKGINNK